MKQPGLGDQSFHDNEDTISSQEQSSTFSTVECERKFPVKVRGISLYTLSDNRQTADWSLIENTKDVGVSSITTYGLWAVRHFIWLPGNNKADTPALTATEAKDIITGLLHRLNELYATNPPVYLIFHIEKLMTPKRPLFYFLHGEPAKEAIDESFIEVKAGFLEECIQPLCNLSPNHTVNGWLPNKFRHYDQESRRLGWLVISPSRALLADVDKEQVFTLAGMLQPYYTDSKNGFGILSEWYRDFLMLIMQWNSNQDNLQSVDRLKELVVSGTNAIDGQVLLNFAIAGIGILIAFLLVPDFKNLSGQLKASLGCLAVASLWFWLFARNGHKVYQVIGWLCVLAIIPCWLLWPQMLSLFDLVVKFFARL